MGQGFIELSEELEDAENRCNEWKAMYKREQLARETSDVKSAVLMQEKAMLRKELAETKQRETDNVHLAKEYSHMLYKCLSKQMGIKGWREVPASEYMEVVMKSYAIEKITWQDSYGVSPGWNVLDTKKAHCPPCDSVGWVVFEDETIIVVAPHRCEPYTLDEPEHICGEMIIPKCAILSREILQGA